MTLVIAHRGASANFPENTLLAFREAVMCNADGMEFDIQRSCDGVPIILHDATLERTTNGTGRSAEASFAHLQSLDAGQGERIPSLAQVLTTLAGRGLTLFIEIKDAAAAEAVALQLNHVFLNDEWQPRYLPVISFDAETLRSVRRVSPLARLGVLANRFESTHAALAKEIRADTALPCIRDLDEPTAALIRDRRLSLFTWTCNRPDDIAKALGLGVDGIMGDDPAVLRHAVDAHGRCI